MTTTLLPCPLHVRLVSTCIYVSKIPLTHHNPCQTRHEWPNEATSSLHYHSSHPHCILCESTCIYVSKILLSHSSRLWRQPEQWNRARSTLYLPQLHYLHVSNKWRYFHGLLMCLTPFPLLNILPPLTPHLSWCQK